MGRLTSQLGVTARWPHPSTELEPIIPAEKNCCIAPPPKSNFTTQIILFSYRKLFPIVGNVSSFRQILI